MSKVFYLCATSNANWEFIFGKLDCFISAEKMFTVTEQSSFPKIKNLFLRIDHGKQFCP
jgi:hypothetical protein